jgi:hypothetical protein
MSHYKGKTMKHEHGESQQVKTSQRLWQALIVASQAAKSCHPGETALHHPSSRQQNEASLGLWQFDDLQTYALCFGCLGWLIARVSLIDESQLDMVACRFLDGGSQFAHLSAILLIGRCDVQRKQISQGINSQMHFATFAPFGSIIARSMAALGTRLQGSTVKNGRRRLFIAPLFANRRIARKSSTMASKTPTLSQRCVCW